ncbi:hypothetical protein [Hanstruepera flava]|uniref:hypothetical protein n=1 Tax=Hanstruepera flava TaxID=2930218 RepID=UPI00202864D7|nr:hypothetical protein [Hanstruepera flava]
MKNLQLYCLAAFIMLFSCNSDDDNTENIPQTIEPEVQILGEWKLISVYHYDPELEIDYSSDNIVFDFKPSNLLVVSGNDDPQYVYTNGEYEYSFEVLPATHPNGNLRHRLKVGNSSWVYLFDHDEVDFILSQIDWDGPVWRFDKN